MGELDDGYPFRMHFNMETADRIRAAAQAGVNLSGLVKLSAAFGVTTAAMQQFVNRNRDLLVADLRRWHHRRWGTASRKAADGNGT